MNNASISHSSQKIFISSSGNAQQGQYNTELFVPIPAIVLDNNDKNNIVIGLESLSIPLSIKMVNDNNNKLEINGVLYIIPTGNYTVITLLAYLNQINIPEFVFTYNADTNRIALTLATGISYIIGTRTTSSKIIGAIARTEVYLSGTPFTSIVNLTSTTGILVQIPNLYTSNYDNITGSSTTIARVPITSQVNQILTYFNPFVFYTTVSNKVIQMLHIKLLDDDHNPIILDGSPTWNIVFRVDYVNKQNDKNPNALIQSLR